MKILYWQNIYNKIYKKILFILKILRQEFLYKNNKEKY